MGRSSFPFEIPPVSTRINVPYNVATMEHRAAQCLRHHAMKAFALGFVLFVASGVVSAAEATGFPLKAVEARIRVDQPAGALTVLPVAKCGAAFLPPEMTPAEFAAKYPLGVYVVCDAQANEGTAHATVLRYLFHASRNQILVAENIDATLVRRDRSWLIRTWHTSNVDYAP